jgi:hypothetical protein
MQDGLDVVLENVEEPVSLSGEGAARQDVKRVDRHAEVRRCGDAAGEERDRLGQEFRRIVERCFGQRRRRRTIRRRRPVVASVALAGEASSRGAPGRGAGRFGGMSAWLLPLLGWLPPRAGRVAVAMSGLVMVGAVMAALTLTASPAGGGRPRRATSRAPLDGTSTRSAPQPVAPPVSAAQLLRSREVAERFLGSYVPFAYGQGGASAPRDRHRDRQTR